MASAYLSRTFGTPTNASKFTYSAWVKRSALGASYILLYANGGNSQNFSNIMFNSSDSFFWHILHSNSEISKLRTNAVLRDTNAWYHLVFQYDSTQATAANRTKMYINGVEVTSYDTQNNSGQNSNYHMNTAVEHIIGAEKGNTGGSLGNYFNGSMSHVHFVDGTIYAPSTFGETDATTGIWKPKTSPGISTANYGNNGFWLKFDNSANMGLDSSGNSNNWTTSGTIIQTKDTPSNVFATMNPLQFNSSAETFSNVNNTLVSTGGGSWTTHYGFSTLAMGSGKYYVEMKADNTGTSGQSYPIGLIDVDQNITSSLEDNGLASIRASNGNIVGSSFTNQTGLTAVSAGDILAIAYDGVNGTLQFYRNGSTHGTAITGIDTSKDYYVACDTYEGSSNFKYNFGNGYFGTTAVSSAQNPTDGVGIFEYTPPTNYRALCTKSINAQEYS